MTEESVYMRKIAELKVNIKDTIINCDLIVISGKGDKYIIKTNPFIPKNIIIDAVETLLKELKK